MVSFLILPCRKWALALGTPVLVVAGFGHVFAILARTFARKLKTQHNERRLSRGISRNDSRESRNEKTTLSSATSVREAGQRSRASSTAPLSTKTLIGSNIAFEIDVGGNDDVICKWPSFIRLENGKALLQATIRTNDFDVEAQQPGPSGRPR